MVITNKDSALATFAFTVILNGLDDIDEGLANRLFEAGCNDAMLGCCDGVVSLEFDREAGSLAEAIGSAVQDVTTAGYRPLQISLADETD